MSSFLRKFLAIGAALLACAITPARANVLLTFNVDSVILETCSGALQPTCSTVDAAGFQRTVVLGGAPMGAPTDSSAGDVAASRAYFGFPLSWSGSPYSSVLRDRVSGTVTSAASYTELDNSFDLAGSVGNASALIFSDLVSDTTDTLGVRRQQEYQLGYTLSHDLSGLLSYTDLVSQSLDDFFGKYVGTVFGSFNELGSSSALDPLSLAFTDYAFSQYMGRVTLIGFQQLDPAAVPEPGSLALLLAGLGLLCARRGRTSRATAALGL